MSSEQAGLKHPTLFFVHGAGVGPSEDSDFQKRYLKSDPFSMPDKVFSRWREETALPMGAASLALSPSRMAEPWSLLRNLVVGKLGNQFVADVITYAVHRDAIISTVRRHLSDVKAESIVVVGHSLGGVILADLLNDPKLPRDPRVKALVTLGSPASWLYALNGIPGLPLSDQARPFGPWINVRNVSDPVASIARTVFNASRTKEQPLLDVEFDSGNLNPETAHTTYHAHAATWRCIRLAVGHALFDEDIPDTSLTEVELEQYWHERQTSLALMGRQFLEETVEHELAIRKLARDVRALSADQDIFEINQGRWERRALEKTGAEYFRTDDRIYTRPAVRARLDDAAVQELLVRYGSLRPVAWAPGSEPWLAVPVPMSTLVTDEASIRLAEEGAFAFRTDECTGEHWD